MKKESQAPAKVRAVIYARYSSHQQTEQSIEGQLRDCRQYAADNGLRVVGTYIDRAKTGTNDNRAEFQRMLRESKAGVFDYVIVWKIDRFGRNREDIAFNRALLRRNGATVVSAKENIPEGPEGIILEGLLESLAEYYSAELNGKVVRGMRESAYKCRYNGSAVPLGFRITADKRFEIDPDTAPTVHLIFDQCEAGKRPAEIARELNEKGFRTMLGNKFGVTAVCRILENRFYCGVYKWDDIVIPDGVPRIISDEQFEKVARIMEKKKKAPVQPKHAGVSYLLTGKVFCGLCGSPVFGDSGTGKHGDRHYYYTCKARKIGRTCELKSVRKEWLEGEIAARVAEFIADDAAVERLAERCVQIQKDEQRNDTRFTALRDNLKRNETARANIIKAIEAGLYTDTIAERLRELETESENIRIDLAALDLGKNLIEKDQIVFFIESLRGGDVNDEDYRRRLLDTFVRRVYLFGDTVKLVLNIKDEAGEISIPIPISDSSGVRITSVWEAIDKLSELGVGDDGVVWMTIKRAGKR